MLSMALYYSCFAPFLYWGFLRDFLRGVALSEYFSDMITNGYFDTNT